MKPYINTPFGNVPTFTLMVIIGMLSMLASVHIVLGKAEDRKQEEMFIIPKLMTAAVAAYFSAILVDAVFKIRENNAFILAGGTFYGGLAGAVMCMWIVLRFSKQKTQYSRKEWFNNLTIPLVIFHFWGRIGCFLAGCCYGKNTDSCLGVYFPDNCADGIMHNGLKCYPTQLFEAVALILIFIIIIKIENRFKLYIVLYSAARFFIEFFRGDDRGYISDYLSPAQVVSVLLILIAIISTLVNCTYKRFRVRQRY